MITRVAIIQDNPHFLEKFVNLIVGAADFTLSGVATDGQKGIALINQGDTDIYIVDLGLPDMSGNVVISHAITMHPGSDVLVVTVFGDEPNILSSIEAGATGYILKSSSPAQILQCLRDLRDGGAAISPLIARYILQRIRGGKLHKEVEVENAPKLIGNVPMVVNDLSNREGEILQLLATGLSFNEMSEKIFISPHTVAKHVKNIYRKLEVHSRGEAVYSAQKLGLID